MPVGTVSKFLLSGGFGTRFLGSFSGEARRRRGNDQEGGSSGEESILGAAYLHIWIEMQI